MATVYKVEVEFVSHWVNYSPEVIEKAFREFINTISEVEHSHNEIDIEKIVVKRKT